MGRRDRTAASGSASENDDSPGASPDSPADGRKNKPLRVSMSSGGGASSSSSTSYRRSTRGRIKLDMHYIQDKSRRTRIFSKRKSGLVNKVKELAKLTGTDMLVLVRSESGRFHKWATPKLQPMYEGKAGKALISKCTQMARSRNGSAAPQGMDDATATAGTTTSNTGPLETMDFTENVLDLQDMDLDLHQQSESLGDEPGAEMTRFLPPGSTTETTYNAQGHVDAQVHHHYIQLVLN